MDVSVSRLNNRLALQLPAELPLGLVFVVGQIANLEKVPIVSEATNGQASLRSCFQLVENEYRLRCYLSERATAEIDLREGDRIRAGGHLAFDARKAHYYLLARDVERVAEPKPPTPPVAEQETELPPVPLGRKALPPVLADIKKRAEVTRLEEAKLPPWVWKMAPPEVRAALETENSQPSEEKEIGQTVELNEEFIATLSEVMENEEDVELTPQMLATLLPPDAPEPQGRDVTSQPYEIPSPEADEPERQIELDFSTAQVQESGNDRFLVLIIMGLLILTILAVLGSVFFLI